MSHGVLNLYRDSNSHSIDFFDEKTGYIFLKLALEASDVLPLYPDRQPLSSPSVDVAAVVHVERCVGSFGAAAMLLAA